MRNNRLFWAIFFLGIGTFFLLQNLGITLFTIDVKFVVPALVVLWGAYLIVKDKTFRSVIAGFNGLLFAMLLCGIFQFGYGVSSAGFEINEEEFNDLTPTLRAKSDSAKYANLNLEFGITGLIIKEDTTDLANLTILGENKNYYLNENQVDDSTKSVDVSMEGKRISFVNGKMENKVRLGLSTKPVWNLNFNSGLSSYDMDLRNYKISDMDIDIGLSSLKLKLGANYPESNVSINAGLSHIEIVLPEDAGVEIETDNGLTETSIKDFQNLGNGNYQSYNFNEAKNKIYLKIKAGLSSVCITKAKW